MTSPEWNMPRPELGDCVLFSTDQRGFTDPAIGWVTSVGDTTINILTFTPGGFFERMSVHHKDDPAMSGEHGWHDLGCWQFSKSALTVRELASNAGKTSGRFIGSR